MEEAADGRERAKELGVTSLARPLLGKHRPRMIYLWEMGIGPGSEIESDDESTVL